MNQNPALLHACGESNSITDIAAQDNTPAMYACRGVISVGGS